MKNQITITRADNGFVLSVDGGSIECATLGAALDILRRESGDVPGSQKWQELEAENARLKKSLDSAAKEFEQLREAIEKEKAEKNKWILEAYDWKDTVTKLGKHIARTCG